MTVTPNHQKAGDMKLNLKAAIVAGTAALMLAAGTGTALAKGVPDPGTTPAPAAGWTRVTFTRDGVTVTEEVPTASLGLVTSDSGLTPGGACILGFSKFTGLGSLAAEANDGASLKELLWDQVVGSIEGLFVRSPDCITYLGHHPKRR